MVKLEKIYFDGKGYLESCLESDDQPDDELIRICSRFNFTPVDSINFESTSGDNFCDITVGDHCLRGISTEHLFTSIQKQTRTVLYPAHNPKPNPGGLYWGI